MVFFSFFCWIFLLHVTYTVTSLFLSFVLFFELDVF